MLADTRKLQLSPNATAAGCNCNKNRVACSSLLTQRRKLMLRQFLCALSIVIFLSPLFFFTGCAPAVTSPPEIPIASGDPVSSISSVPTNNPSEWLAFRGADGNSKSTDTGLLQQWPDGGPRLLWQVNFIGYGYSGVSVSGDRIYTSGYVTRNGEALTMIFCLDLDGNLIWENDNGPALADRRRYPGTRGTPTIAGDFIFDISPFGQITCFNAMTGEIIWSRKDIWNRTIIGEEVIRTEYNAPMPHWFLGHSVIVDGDYVITPVGGQRTIAIAMDKRTGETVWEAAPAAGGAPTTYTTPYIFEFEGTRVVAIMSNITVEGLDPATGRTLFSIPWVNREPDTRSVHCTMPIYHNGHLFLSSGYEHGTSRLFQLAKNDDGTITATEMWVDTNLNNHHGGIVLVGDYVYGTDHNGTWHSINFMTGVIGFSSRAAGKGSVTYADGLLYGLTENDRTVLLIKPEPTEFLLISRFDLPNEVAGPSWAHPVVIGSRMYLRHGQYLYCYDVGAE